MFRVLFNKNKEKAQIEILIDTILGRLKGLEKEAANKSVDLLEKELDAIKHQMWLFRFEVKKMVFVEQFEEIDWYINKIENDYLRSTQREEIVNTLEPFFEYSLPKEEKFRNSNGNPS